MEVFPAESLKTWHVKKGLNYFSKGSTIVIEQLAGKRYWSLIIKLWGDK